MSRSVIYEITTTVEENSVETYEKYMREQHIPDLLATGFFTRAFFTRSAENAYRVQYHAPNRTSLDEYLKSEADRLRADFAAHFPKGISVEREVWEIVESW